jgi:hypothetical protein
LRKCFSSDVAISGAVEVCAESIGREKIANAARVGKRMRFIGWALV